jgi:hypothetical protein
MCGILLSADNYVYNIASMGVWVSSEMCRSGNGRRRRYIHSINDTLRGRQKSCQIPRQRRSLRRRKRPTFAVGFFEADQPGDMLFGLIPRMPSCASLFTLTTATRMALVPPSGFVCMPSLSVVSQHGRSFVFEVLVKELSIRSIIIRWRNPFPWYNAWEGYADASSAVDPRWRSAAGQLFTEVRGKVVAVLGEEVVGGALELYRGLYGLARRSPVVRCHTSWMMASSSSCGRNVKPWTTACRNVPPGGSRPGFVQYTPETPRRSCPPYAYSLSPTTTPECRRELPMAHSTAETLPGGRRS